MNFEILNLDTAKTLKKYEKLIRKLKIRIYELKREIYNNKNIEINKHILSELKKLIKEV